MLTIFACPKPFRGVTAIHQYNAIESWKRIHPNVQVILVGNDQGVAEASRELSVTHLAECERTDFGTPLVSSIFTQARTAAAHEILCYVNADIILTRFFLACLAAVRRRKDRFLLVGHRYDVDLDEKVDFEESSWERQLAARCAGCGKFATEWFIDYFAFPREELQNMPPFAVGRARWDNWMIWKARASGVPVIDASAFTTAIHQNHDYTHHPEGKAWAWEGPEASANHELAGGWEHLYSLADCTHKILCIAGQPYLFPLGVFGRKKTAIRLLSHAHYAFQLAAQGKWASLWSRAVERLARRSAKRPSPDR